jgi:hypothetical protein
MADRRRRRRDARVRGAAGIEFALIASTLMALMIGLVDLGSLVSQRREMNSAIRSGASYFMVGGVDLAEAEAAMRQSWSGMPPETIIDVVKTCYCAGLEHSCTADCPDTSLPEAFHIITATTVFNGIIAKTEHQVAETVRIR